MNTFNLGINYHLWHYQAEVQWNLRHSILEITSVSGSLEIKNGEIAVLIMFGSSTKTTGQLENKCDWEAASNQANTWTLTARILQLTYISSKSTA